jgi:hypothetical protein
MVSLVFSPPLAEAQVLTQLKCISAGCIFKVKVMQIFSRFFLHIFELHLKAAEVKLKPCTAKKYHHRERRGRREEIKMSFSACSAISVVKSNASHDLGCTAGSCWTAMNNNEIVKLNHLTERSIS